MQHNCLIVHFTFSPLRIAQNVIEQQSNAPKTIKLYYWKDEKWHQEETKIVWDRLNPSLNLKQVIKQWVKVHQDEQLVSPHLAVESVTLSSPESEAFLSFDRTLFNADWSIMQKWLIIESIFKTIHHAQFHITSISLLVHHQPMDDDHLDLSQPLPVQERL